MLDDLYILCLAIVLQWLIILIMMIVDVDDSYISYPLMMLDHT